MHKTASSRGNILTFLLVIIVVALFGFMMFIKFKPNLRSGSPQTIPPSIEKQGLKRYSSEDLNISFYYPDDWFLIEKGYDILLTSYPTYFDENRIPTSEQIELFISIFSNCFPDYEQDLVYPGCGEGGEASKNTIVSKEGRPVQAGTFYKYVVRTPRNEEFTYYILYKDDKNILQIDKRPGPSQFEKEFEGIISSIEFLD